MTVWQRSRILARQPQLTVVVSARPDQENTVLGFPRRMEWGLLFMGGRVPLLVSSRLDSSTTLFDQHEEGQ